MRFSVIIPVYNNPENIRLCINNITDQSFQDYEIIIVDDASNDHTAKSIKEIDNNKIVIISNANNVGPGISRNKGLEKARGEYIIFLDCDDRLETDILVDLDRCISVKNNVDVYICKYVDLSDNKTNNILFNNNISTHYDLKKFSINKSYFINTCWFMIYRNEYLNRNNIKFQNARVSEDVTFCAEVICKANNIEFYPKLFYKYSGSSSSTHLVNLEVIRGYERMLKYLKGLIKKEINKINTEYLKNRHEYLYRSYILRATLLLCNDNSAKVSLHESIINKISNFVEEVRALISTENVWTIYVFCLTFESLVVCKILSRYFKIGGILDNDARKHDLSYHGFNIFDPMQKLNLLNDRDVIIICNPNKNIQNILFQQLIQNHVVRERIIKYYPFSH